jgi:hypothetical protein
MSARFDHLQSDEIFNWSQFEKNVDRDVAAYDGADPFPYIYYDGLFSPDFLRKIVAEFPPLDHEIWQRTNDPEIQVKLRSNWKTEADIPPHTLQAVQILNSGRFMRGLSKLTGISGLIADHYYTGGGLNQIIRDGVLALHVDGTRHDYMDVQRRLNSIVYFNENWKPSYNGDLELWNVDMTECRKKIAPHFNRLVVFTTNDFTPHGHPTPVACPEGMSRKSLIHYYYTSKRPASDLKQEGMHRALFTKSSDLPKARK